jgi:DUF4097 and DUF4098 domain-containing protein YvlB
LIRADRIDGEQLFVSKTGPISGKRLKGHIEFHTQQAPVELVESSGFLSGRTESGNITARMIGWKFSDKALLESGKGSIQLFLPAAFSGDIDLWSVNGKAEISFPFEKTTGPKVGPEPPNHLLGRVGEGGEILKILTEKGDIALRKLD